MTARAEVLAMAGRAEISRRRGTDTMLTDEVALVQNVARRTRELRRQVHVAAVAVTGLPLVLVRVTAEALCHRRTEGRLLRLPRCGVARDTLARELRNVPFVSEAQVLASEPILLAGSSIPVTAVALPSIVRTRVTAHTRRGPGQMKRPGLPRPRDPFMTAQAPDPRERMSAVLERMLRVARLDPEQARTSREREQQKEQEGPRERLHGVFLPKEYDTRASAFRLSLYSGPDDASTAVAISQPVLDVQAIAASAHGQSEPRRVFRAWS